MRKSLFLLLIGADWLAIRFFAGQGQRIGKGAIVDTVGNRT